MLSRIDDRLSGIKYYVRRSAVGCWRFLLRKRGGWSGWQSFGSSGTKLPDVVGSGSGGGGIAVLLLLLLLVLTTAFFKKRPSSSAGQDDRPTDPEWEINTQVESAENEVRRKKKTRSEAAQG